MTNLKFGVLGAGVVGTTTALELQKRFPNADVTIVAEKFNRETTSDVAAGIFRPPTNFWVSTEEISKTIIKESYEYYDDIIRNHEPKFTGVSQISGYMFSGTSQSLVRNHLIEDVVPLYRPATLDELKLCPGNWKFGSFFETIITECRRYLPWSLARFQENNGKVITQKIKDLKDFGNYDIIINCLGLGAKEICNDRKLIPIRGQVLKVSAPWLKNFFYADYDTYIIPGLENVTLGGCRNFESYDCKINRHDTASIWERCTALVPRLGNCEIDRQFVGLRPYRDPVRLEIEITKTNVNKPLKIVHNYGHGGCGVTIAPGTAKHAVRLVEQILKSNSKL